VVFNANDRRISKSEVQNTLRRSIAQF